MKVIIEGRVNVDGQWWDIDIDVNVDPQKSSAQKVEHIKAAIRGVASTGEIISRVGAVKSPYGEEKAEHEPEAPNGSQSAMFTWPLPHCGLHNEPMTLSKVQKDPAKVSFYCPKRHGDDYCKHRAKVDNSSGMPSFFEVK